MSCSPRIVCGQTFTFAADKMPTTKTACEKAKMHWDDATKTCTKGSM
jgi:hypothetical protein